jgi:hypothetical protein
MLHKTDANLPASDASEQNSEIKDAELILTAFRTLLLLILALAPRVLNIEEAYSREAIVLLLLGGIYNIGMAIASLFPSKFGVRRPIILAMDTTLISAWIHFSGRFELIPFYYVVVVVAAMWYRVFGGVVAAAVCNFLFLFLWGRMAGNFTLQQPPAFTSSMAINSTILFVIGILAGYIAEAQERERLRRLERELLIANYQNEIDISGEIQPLLLSRLDKNAHSGLDIGVQIRSARAAGGGDYLDAIPLPEGKTLLCIADVAGKSVRAQARVPLLKYSLRALAPLHSEPAELMARLQETLLPDLQNEFYIAICLIVLDAQYEELSYCNAGHIAPFMIRGNIITRLETTCPALGLFPEIPPKSKLQSWKRGDALLLFTDGLTDALSFGGTVDGEVQVDKLAQKIGVNAAIPAGEAAQELIQLSEAALDDKPFVAKHFTMGENIVGDKVRRDDVAVLVARCGK